MALVIYYQRIRDELFQTIKRFPLAVLCSLAFCFMAIKQGHSISPPLLMLLRALIVMTIPGENPTLDLMTYLQIFFCGACWFVAFQLFWEGQGYRQKFSYLLAIPVFLIISRYIQTQTLADSNIMMLGLGLFFLIFCAPFLRNARTDLQFWLFSYRLWIRIGYGLIAALILLIGVTAILSCLEYLFSLKFSKDQYKDLGVVTFTFFLPVLILSGIGRNFNEQPQEPGLKPMYYLLKYLVIPFIFIYSLILYAYMVKITVMQSLPRGGVVYLVASYGGVGILAYLVSIPQDLAIGRLVGFFRDHFFKILFFPTVLLGIAISYRLQQYGLTEARYVVILCGVLFSCSIVYSFIIPPQFFAKVMYTTLPCLLLLAAVGPWSINSLPALQQIRSLEKILQHNHMLKDGQVIPGKYDLNEADKVQLSEILDYLCQRKTRLNYLKPLLNETMAKELFESNKYIKSKDVANVLGVEYVKRKSIQTSDAFAFGVEPPPSFALTGYDYYIPTIHLYNGEQLTRLAASDQKLTFYLNPVTGLFIIKNNGHEIFIPLGEELILPLVKLEGDNEAIRKKLTLPFKHDGIKGLLMIQNVSGDFNKETNKVKIRSLHFSLLIGKD